MFPFVILFFLLSPIFLQYYYNKYFEHVRVPLENAWVVEIAEESSMYIFNFTRYCQITLQMIVNLFPHVLTYN